MQLCFEVGERREMLNFYIMHPLPLPLRKHAQRIVRKTQKVYFSRSSIFLKHEKKDMCKENCKRNT